MDTTNKSAVLSQPVALDDSNLSPLPKNWTVLQSVLFLALCASLQRIPGDDLIQASFQVAEATGAELGEINSTSQMVMNWAQETLEAGHIGHALLRHSGAVVLLGPEILRNEILPVLKFLAENVGDVSELNGGVVRICTKLWGSDEKDRKWMFMRVSSRENHPTSIHSVYEVIRATVVTAVMWDKKNG